MPSVLVVDDEPRMLKILSMELVDEGYRVITASNGSEALRAISEQEVDAVITDMRMPDISGHDILRHVKATSPHTPVIIVTAHGTVENAVSAMLDGATNYILKPANMAELKLVLKRSLDMRRLVLENQFLREEIAERRGYEDLIGEAPSMQIVFQTIDLVAPTDSTVLILGPSGTGKELVAQAIHRRSPRAGGPFVPINCVAVPQDLLESELFGHVKGAFTSAVSSKPGKFELAGGGTLFLDEIGDMSQELQGKLLRAIQERVIEPVGARESRKVDVRIVAATNADLEAKVKAGRFRSDLYYRLNVVPITMPPLRERKSDIPLLTNHFLAKKSHGQPPFTLNARTLEALMRYEWPGNVRELENLVERAVVLRSQAVLENVLPPGNDTIDDSAVHYLPLLGSPYKDAKKKILDTFEQAYFTHHLRLAGGNISRAAESAGMHRKNFYQKLADLNLNPHEGHLKAEDE